MEQDCVMILKVKSEFIKACEENLKKKNIYNEAMLNAEKISKGIFDRKKKIANQLLNTILKIGS